MSKEYKELLKKRVNEPEKKLPPISPRKSEEVRIVYGKVSDEFFKPKNWSWVAGLYYGDGTTGYMQRYYKGKAVLDQYYPFVSIAQHERGMEGLEVVCKLWLTKPHEQARHMFRAMKTGKIVITILKTILPRLYAPKREEAEFIIERRSPVSYKVKEEYAKRFRAKSRKAVIKGSQEVRL
ncbi:MAG: hypothetical protein H3Z54_12635 [archaeon]|nr:hypothetical protein [archaeon]